MGGVCRIVRGGGIIVGQSETPPSTIDARGNEIPFMLNHHVNVRNNSVTGNTVYGDELNSNTPAASGGITFCDGSDYLSLTKTRS